MKTDTQLEEEMRTQVGEGHGLWDLIWDNVIFPMHRQTENYVNYRMERKLWEKLSIAGFTSGLSRNENGH
jgi:hypothetical protein